MSYSKGANGTGPATAGASAGNGPSCPALIRARTRKLPFGCEDVTRWVRA